MNKKNKKNKRVVRKVRAKRNTGRVKTFGVPRDPDVFADDSTPINADDAFVSQPSADEVREVISELDGFRQYQEESRGNGLTFGDY